MNDTELAYLAGFFDGEGSISIGRSTKPRGGGRVLDYNLWLTVNNTDPTVLLWGHSYFKGHITRIRRINPKHRDILKWGMAGRDALRFLQTILPFLRVKRKQAEIGVAFQLTKRLRGPHRISPEEFQWREEQRQAIIQLNAKHHLPKGADTLELDKLLNSVRSEKPKPIPPHLLSALQPKCPSEP